MFDTPETERGAAGQRRRARLVFTVILAGLTLWVARDYLVALAWAVLIAVTVWPFYRRFAAWMPARPGLAAVLFTLFSSLALLVPALLVAVEVGQEAQTAVAWISEVQQHGIPAPDWLKGVPLLGGYVDQWWQSHLSRPADAKVLFESLGESTFTNWSAAFGGHALHLALLLLVMVLALFLLFRDGEQIAARLVDRVDRVLGSPGDRLTAKLVKAVRGTVAGTLMVALGEGVLIGLGYVVAGVPHAVLFGILTAACALLPLGAWIAFGVAAVSLLMNGGSALASAGVFAWGAVVMLTGDNFVQPALIGGAAKLPLLAALIGILGGLASFGLIGLFLGPVLMAAALTVWREWLGRDLPP